MNAHDHFLTPRRPGPQRESRLPPAIVKTLCGVIGLVFTLGGLLLTVAPINAAAYYLGYGDEVQVEVTRSSIGSMWGRDSEKGEGLVTGEGRVVHLSMVTRGETVTARPALFDISLAHDEFFRVGAPVYEHFVVLIGVAMLGGFGLTLLLGAAVMPWRRQTGRSAAQSPVRRRDRS